MIDIVCAWVCEYARAIRRPIPALAAEVDDEVVRRVALLPRGESASGRLRARAQERKQRSERVCGGESEGEGCRGIEGRRLTRRKVCGKVDDTENSGTHKEQE